MEQKTGTARNEALTRWEKLLKTRGASLFPQEIPPLVPRSFPPWKNSFFQARHRLSGRATSRITDLHYREASSGFIPLKRSIKSVRTNVTVRTLFSRLMQFSCIQAECIVIGEVH